MVTFSKFFADIPKEFFYIYYLSEAPGFPPVLLLRRLYPKPDIYANLPPCFAYHLHWFQ